MGRRCGEGREGVKPASICTTDQSGRRKRECMETVQEFQLFLMGFIYFF